MTSDPQAELTFCEGDFTSSDMYVQQCLEHVDVIENKCRILRLRSRNFWIRGDYAAALNDTLTGLHLLGVEVNAAPSRREADIMFEKVKNEILAVGFEDILLIPRARDTRTELAIALLNDAGEALEIALRGFSHKHGRHQCVLEYWKGIRRCHWPYCASFHFGQWFYGLIPFI